MKERAIVRSSDYLRKLKFINAWNEEIYGRDIQKEVGRKILMKITELAQYPERGISIQNDYLENKECYISFIDQYCLVYYFTKDVIIILDIITEKETQDYYWNEKARDYVEDSSEYGLAYTVDDPEKEINLLKWYSFLAEYGCSCEEHPSDQQEKERIGRKSVDRLSDILKNLDVCDDVDRRRRDHDIDYIKLITFLHKVSRNEKESDETGDTRRINLGSLFKKLSVENFDEVPGEEHLPYNSNLITLIYTVLRQMSDDKKLQGFSEYIWKTENMIYDLENLLWDYLVQDEGCGALDKIKGVVEQELKDVDYINSLSDENEYSIYEIFMFRLELYEVLCENIEVMKVFEYIKKITINISDLDQNLLADWRKTPILMSDVSMFAQKNKKVIIKCLGISEKKYNTIVGKWLPQYFKFMENMQSIDGLYVWAMIEEIANSLGDKLDKDMINFYHAGTAVSQKTLKASLRSESKDLPNVVQMVLVERVKARYIAYLHRLPEYFIVLDVLKEFRKKAMVITKSRNFGQLFVYGALVLELLDKIKEILEDED